jgi:pyruvate/2-oxoglutarate dehydrogenase complex dihydrolipoamide acyltransferase (E2) component
LLKIKGTNVQKGEALLEVETDKVNVEIEAPEDGLRDEITCRSISQNSAPWLP